MRKLKEIVIVIIAIASMICTASIIPANAITNDKTVHVNYYLTDDQENYINWDGERIDLEQRILVKEETYVNLAQDSYVWGTTHFTTSDGIQLYLSVGMKKVDYKGKNSCDIIFGAYMDNTVNFMDWRSSQDHTYEQVDSKPVRFPYNLGYEAKDPAQKEGYTFMGWYDEQGYRFEKDSIIKEDLNVYAKYVKNSEKKVYTVNHYTEQLNGEYKNYESKKNQASNNQLILAESMIKTGLTGFIFNAEKSDKSIVAGQDDELNLYYDRDIKTVTFMNGNETLSVQNIKYEGKATMPETPIREGYRFIKWNTRMDGNGRDFNVNDSVIYDSVYYAIFESVPSYQYTIKYYQEDIKGYKLIQSENKSAFKGTVINATDQQKNVYDGYKYNNEKSDKNIEIVQDQQVISFYYDRIEYPYVIQYYYDGVLDIDKNENGSGYLNDIITEFVDKNKEGFKLLSAPALTIGKDENVMKVEYVREQYQVRFLDKDGQVIKSETVKYGDFARAPEAPQVTGMHFTGWDKDMTNITASLDITAQYKINTYTVEFQDQKGNTISRQVIEYGQDATLPDVPTIEGYEFTGWKGTYQNIQNDEIVTAQYRQIGQTVIPPADDPSDVIPPTQPPTELPEITVPAPTLPTPPDRMIVTGDTNQQTSLIGGEVSNNQNDTEQEEIAQITDQQTPKSHGAVEKQWAVLNLIAVMLSLILAIALLLSKRNKEDEDMRTRRRWTKVVAIIIAVVSIVIFVVTENIFLPMKLTDQYTIIMLGLSLIQIVMTIIGRKYKDNGQLKQTVINES